MLEITFPLLVQGGMKGGIEEDEAADGAMMIKLPASPGVERPGRLPAEPATAGRDRRRVFLQRMELWGK